MPWKKVEDERDTAGTTECVLAVVGVQFSIQWPEEELLSRLE